jgi:hypothetical protein
VRDWTAKVYERNTGRPTSTEQRVPEWDMVDPDTGELERAVLDMATSDYRTGRPLWLDAVITCEHSEDLSRQRARAVTDGCAAALAANAKRSRYALAGCGLVPFSMEAGGRPSEEAAAWVRACGATAVVEDGGVCTGALWHQLSSLIQLGNGEMLLSAVGCQ